MSVPENTGFKKPSCGNMFNLGGSSGLRDSIGGIVNLQIVGTDPDVGVVDGSALAADYAPAAGNKNPDGTFMICIETSGAVYHVRLADGTEFTITAVQSEAYAGQWYPARIIEVLVGTTGDFSVGY